MTWLILGIIIGGVILYIGVIAHTALNRADTALGLFTWEDNDTTIRLELLYYRLKAIEEKKKRNR